MISVSVQIDPNAAEPIRAQISGAYAAAIRAGRLPAGAPLPSVRGLSGRLGVSPATVVAAYRELCAAGLATASPRSAFRVAGKAAVQERSEFFLNRIEPDLRIHPVAEFGRLVAEVAAADCSAGGYEDYRGHRELREAMAELDAEIGVASDPANGLLVTAGAQHALALIARLLGAGATVAVEDPCYPGARIAFSSAGARLVPLRITDDGPAPDALRAIARRGAVTALYCCPTYANPTGRSWSEEARRRVMKAASDGGFLIIEDDFLGDLDYLEETPTRLAALAAEFPKARVARIRTFSKCLLPALRIAGVTGDAGFIDRLLPLRIADDLCGSALLQRALARFIRSGDYRRHLERVRPRYRAVREALRVALSGLDGRIRFDDPPAGLCLLGRVAEEIDFERFLAECANAGVHLSHGKDYWHDAADGARRFRMGFGSLSPDEVGRIADVMERAANSTAGFGTYSIL